MIHVNNKPTTAKKATALIALYKAGEYIESKIKNILQQTAFKDCWFVFLNCQNLHDESKFLLKAAAKHDNFIIIDIDDYMRLYSTWNIGIELTQSTYITNANVDDHWHPEYLEKCMGYLDTNNEIGIVSTEVYVTNIKNQKYPNWQHLHKMPAFIYPESTAGPSPMWRRSLHDKYGMFDDYHVISDARQWEKYLAGGEKFGLIYEPLVLYYMNPESLERRRGDDGRLLRDIDLA